MSWFLSNKKCFSDIRYEIHLIRQNILFAGQLVRIFLREFWCCNYIDSPYIAFAEVAPYIAPPNLWHDLISTLKDGNCNMKINGPCAKWFQASILTVNSIIYVDSNYDGPNTKSLYIRPAKLKLVCAENSNFL